MKIPAYLGREIIGTRGINNTWKYSLDKEINIDLSRLEHFGIFARSGGGKSYAMGDLAEESIIHKNNFATLIIDPLGNFTTMKIKNTTDEVEIWNKNLNRNELKPTALNDRIRILIPKESIPFIDESMYDGVFGLNADSLTDDLFCYAFGMQTSDLQPSLLRKTKRFLDKAGTPYTLSDISIEIRNQEAHPQTIDALANKLDILYSLGLITNNAPEIYDILKPNTTTILNLSMSSSYTNKIIVNFLAKQLIKYRSIISSKINLAKIKLEQEEEQWRQYNNWYQAPTRIIIDEAHEFIPGNSTLKKLIKKGRNLGIVVGVVSQSADLSKTVYANMTHLFVGQMRFNEDINLLRNLTSTDLTPDEFKKIIKRQGNGNFVYFNLNKDTYKEMKFRPRLTLHPASNQVQDEKKYLIIGKGDKKDINEIFQSIIDIIGKKPYNISDLPKEYHKFLIEMERHGYIVRNNDSIMWSLKKVKIGVEG